MNREIFPDRCDGHEKEPQLLHLLQLLGPTLFPWYRTRGYAHLPELQDLQRHPVKTRKSTEAKFQRGRHEQFGSAQNGGQLGFGFHRHRRRLLGLPHATSRPQLS